MGGKKEEFTPLLPPGLHSFRLDALRRLCVERFPSSITRRRIMDNLERLIGTIQSNGMRGDIWIDGSFLTEKLNPDDVDLVLVIEEVFLNSMDARQRGFFEWFSSNSLYEQFKCDNYVWVRGSDVISAEYMHAYWLRQFGFSRASEMKGLAVVAVPFLVMP